MNFDQLKQRFSGAIQSAPEEVELKRVNHWHQHSNGLGWVEDTAQVAESAYVGPDARVSENAQVYGNAWVYGDAQVYGNARVSGYAQVYDNAQVYGYAQVSEYARVISGTWKKSPLYIQGTRDSVTYCGPDQIAIGCEIHSFSEWLEQYETIGRKNGYTEAEIEEYKEYIDCVVRKRKKERKKMNQKTQNLIRKQYGQRTLNVVRLMEQGYSTHEIARKLRMSRSSVATYRANFTRGVYPLNIR